MTIHTKLAALLAGSTALRGIARVRAESDPAAEALDIARQIKAALDTQKKTFEDFKVANDKDISELKKGRGDVVQSELVNRINSDITKLGETITDLNGKVAALSINGAGDRRQVTADQKAHARAFDGYFRKGLEPDNMRELEVKAAVSVGSDPDGGWTVPVEVDTVIARVLATVSAMRQIATVQPIGSDTYRKMVNQGGTGFGWVGENAVRPGTDTSKLTALDFPAMELYAMPAATQRLLDDSNIDIAEWLAAEVGIVFAEQEGTAFISGDGNVKPKGLLAYGTVDDDDYAWGKLGYVATGAADDFADTGQADVLVDLAYALRQGYRTNGSWLMNRKTAAAIRKFKDSTGNYLWQPSLQMNQPSTLLGYPSYDDDNMDDIGANKYPVAFGDFKRGYVIVDRMGVRVLRDPYSAKPNVLFYTTKRVGGGVQNFEAIKLLKIAAS